MDPQIESWCRLHPGVVLYGEIYGPVQDLKYGCSGQIKFAAFAAYDRQTGRWYNQIPLFESLEAVGVCHSPVLFKGPFNLEQIRIIAEQDSKVSTVKQLSEGVVVVPEIERLDPAIGRVCLKVVSFRYLSK